MNILSLFKYYAVVRKSDEQDAYAKPSQYIWFLSIHLQQPMQVNEQSRNFSLPE